MTISTATSPELLNGGVGARLAVADDARMSSSHPRAGGPSRRGSFTAAEKLEHLQGYELACEQQQAGAYLRREGMYSSQVVEWRRLRDAGVLDAKAKAKATARKAGRPTGEQGEIARLRRQLEVTQRRLDTTETALSVSLASVPRSSVSRTARAACRLAPSSGGWRRSLACMST